MRSVCSMIVDREFGDAVILGNTESASPSSPSTTAQAAGGGVGGASEISRFAMHTARFLGNPEFYELPR